MGVVVPHQLNGMFRRDFVLIHEVRNLWIGLNLSGGFSGVSPGEVVSLRRGSSSSSFPRVSPVLGQVASLLVADEAFAVSNMLCSFTQREIDLVHIRSVGVGARGSVSQQNIAVSSSSEFPESYHVSVELPCLI